MPKNTLPFTVVFLLAFISAAALAKESDRDSDPPDNKNQSSAINTITVSSFLPSPHAHVQTLRFNAHDEPAGACDIGRVFMDTAGNIQICQDGGFSVGTYNYLGGWKQSGNSLYPSATATNSSLKIGIGTSTPSTKLHIQSASGATTAVTRIQNTTGDFDIFVTNTTPEGAVTGNKGDLAVDTTNGILYIKKSNGGNTSWSASGASQNIIKSVKTTVAQSGWGGSSVFATSTTDMITPEGGITLNAAGVFTVPVDGIYEILAVMPVTKSGSGAGYIIAYVNGVSIWQVSMPSSGWGYSAAVPFSNVLRLNAGDGTHIAVSASGGWGISANATFAIRKIAD